MIVLPPDVIRLVREHCAREFPSEACGVLLGIDDGGSRRVERAWPGRNVATAPDRFALHPEDLLAADAAAREEGLEIVGIYHSHPDLPPQPSATDLAGAQPGWSYLIVTVTRDGAGEARAWRLAGGRFEPEPLVQR